MTAIEQAPEEISLNGHIYRRVTALDCPDKIHSIKVAVCDFLNITLADLNSRRKLRRVVLARWYVFALAREQGHTLTEIGESFNGTGKPFDHGTVLHGVKQLKIESTYDKSINENLSTLRKQLHLTK